MATQRFCFKLRVLVAICASFSVSHAMAEETLRMDNVVVSYSGISQEYARAIGRTTAAARSVASEQYGFDMPERITVTVAVSPQGKTRLFNDGQDRFSLTVRSENELLSPRASGIFHLYGLCHEVGHLAMYRPIRNHSWMTTAAAEGWAHYLGSRIVDAVFTREGEDLWPDRYDYRSDGMKRLLKQLASADPGDVSKGAGHWKDLAEIVGDRGIAPIFAAWGKAKPDSADPAAALSNTLSAVNGDAPVAAWWKNAQVAFVLKRPKSDFASGAITRDQLVGRAQELACDDGRAAGKASIAGGGHAVRFEADDDSWCVTSIRIHGARYGQPAAPTEDFHVWICDEDFKAIADLTYAYSKFKWGQFQWVALPVKPIKVPQRFIVCAGFNPTATKGVYVSRDGESSGDSLSGLPGGQSRPTTSGDWMIRASITRLKAAAGPGASSNGGPPATVFSSQLVGKAEMLRQDDGQQAGKQSIAGGGHAVRFEAASDSTYLTQVRIYGSRYGHPMAPREDFHVWLCDEDFKEIADFSFPYSKFKRAAPEWVMLRIKPTRVPRTFIICAGFNPTGTKGVFVGRDAESSGNSLSGLPGGQARPTDNGDWMIRATVDQLKAPAASTQPSLRTWTDTTGKFRTPAEYVGFDSGMVKLKRPDGTVIQVPLEKLSAADRLFVLQQEK